MDTQKIFPSILITLDILAAMMYLFKVNSGTVKVKRYVGLLILLTLLMAYILFSAIEIHGFKIAWCPNWRKVLYWLFAAGLSFTVTY